MPSQMSNQTAPTAPERYPHLVVTVLGLAAAASACLAYANMPTAEQLKKSQARAALQMCVTDAIRDTGRMPEHEVRGTTVYFLDRKGKEIARSAITDYEVTGNAMADPSMNENLIRVSGTIYRRCNGLAKLMQR